MTSNREPRRPRRLGVKPANSNRPYQPAPYAGDGIECIANLSPDTNRPDVLLAVAAWHDVPWRRAIRNSTIAKALRRAANDNVRRAA